jgi:hypothetical protein
MAASTFRVLWHAGNPGQGYYTDFSAAGAGEAGWQAHQYALGLFDKDDRGAQPVLVSVTQLPAADPAPAASGTAPVPETAPA